MTSKPSLKFWWLIAALLQIVWGVVPSASQMVIKEIPVELYIALRWTISGLIFALFLGWRRPRKAIPHRTLGWVAFFGILGYGVGSMGMLYGLRWGGVVHFALMGALNPLLTSIVAITLLKERPQRGFFFALPLCLLGLSLLVFGRYELSSWQLSVGSSLILMGAALLEALVFALSQKWKSHLTSNEYLATTQLATAAFMWTLQFSYFHQTAELSRLSAEGWAAALFVSIVACVLCYGILYWLLNFVEGHRLALFDGLHTISATIFGMWFFQEPLNSTLLLGGSLMLLGLVAGQIPDTKLDLRRVLFGRPKPLQ